MPYPAQEQEGLTRDQAEALRELNSFKQVSGTAAWKAIIAKIDAMVTEAQEELLGCDPLCTAEQRGILSIRWQQREAMGRGLKQFVESQVNQHLQLIEEINEFNSSDTSGDPGSHDQ